MDSISSKLFWELSFEYFFEEEPNSINRIGEEVEEQQQMRLEAKEELTRIPKNSFASSGKHFSGVE